MHNVKQSTHAKALDTLEFKMTKRKRNFNFDQPSNREKWMMGVTILQVDNTVDNTTERNNKFVHYILGYYEQKPVFREFQKTIGSKYTRTHATD